MALISIASSLEVEAEALDAAGISATKIRRSQLAEQFERKSR